MGSIWLWNISPEVQAKKPDPSRSLPTRLAQAVVIARCGASALAGPVPVLRTDTPCAEARAVLEHIAAPHTFRFLWYDPDANLYSSAEELGIRPDAGGTGYHRTATIVHKLSIAKEQAALIVGEWRVVAQLDGVPAGEARFRIEDPPAELPPTLKEAQSLYLDLQYNALVQRLGASLNTTQPGPLEAQARWWMALSLYALGKTEESQQALAELLKADPAYGVSPEEAKKFGATELRRKLEQLRKATYPDLYVKTGFPAQVELSRPETAPVLSRRWPLWKKLLIYGGIPVAAGAGVLLFAGGGGDSGPEPLEMSPSIAGSEQPKFECVPISAGQATISRTFTVDVRGGSGNYGIEWNFNRGRGNAGVTPLRATDVRTQQVSYAVRSAADLGSYIISIEVRDKDVPSLPPLQDALILILNAPSVCNP
jgi:hypothetical protein